MRKNINKYVMDSAVILNNFNFSFKQGELYLTTNSVLDEMIDLRSRQLVEVGLKEGFIEIREPSQNSLELIEKAARELGIERRLAPTDKSILALALELNLPLLSDDYQIQKVCIKLGLKYDSVFREKIEK
ncbi:hypothetical protein KJ660_00940 [Candidatus Micrarchaeota archaeon]|nr:hypothetical protein [Candidatus Micrarchaeota archaeon]